MLTGIYVVGVLSRLLGPQGYGQYVIATSIVLAFRSVVVFGADPIAVREIAAGRVDGDRFLSCLFVLRLVVAVLAFVAAGAFAHLLGFPPVVRRGVWCYGIVLFLVGPLSFGVALRAKIMMWPQFLQTVAHGAFWAAAVTILARSGAGPIGILWAGVAAGAVSCAVLLIFSFKHVRPMLHVDLRAAWWMAKESAPLFGQSFLAGLMISLPIWILGRCQSPAAAALFAAPMRIMIYLCFIPSALAQCILPALSGRLARDPLSARRLYLQFLWAMTAVGAVLGGLVLLNASRIVMLVFGEQFVRCVPTLRMLTVVFGATCVGIGGAWLSVALGRQKVNLIVSAAQLVAFAVPALALRMGPFGVAVWLTVCQCAVAAFWVLFAASRLAGPPRVPYPLAPAGIQGGEEVGCTPA